MIVNGTIVDDRGIPVAGAIVIVFSTDRDRWFPTSRYLRSVTGIAKGAFTVEGSWQDPEFLTSLMSRATSLTLGDGHDISLSLRVVTR